MQTPFALALALIAVTISTAHATAAIAALDGAPPEAPYAAANSAFFEALVGVPRSDALTTVRVNGEPTEMTVAALYDRLGAMSGRADLGARATPAVAGLFNVGDFHFWGWACASTQTVPQPFFVQLDPSLWIYPGYVSFGSCELTFTYGFTDKTAETYPASRFAGSGSLLEFFGWTYGMLDGVILKA